MLNLSIIAFRESLEVLVILIALFTYLFKINEKTLVKYIIFGSLFGILVSIILGPLIFKIATSFSQYSQNVFTSIIKFSLSAMILYFLVFIRKQQNSKELLPNSKYNFNAISLWLIIFSFLSVLRESLEVVYSALLIQGKSTILIIIVCLIGVTSSLIVAFMIFKTLLKIDLKILFNLTTIFLIYIGASLCGGALALILPHAKETLETAGFLVFIIPTGYAYIKNSIKEILSKT